MKSLKFIDGNFALKNHRKTFPMSEKRKICVECKGDKDMVIYRVNYDAELCFPCVKKRYNKEYNIYTYSALGPFCKKCNVCLYEEYNKELCEKCLNINESKKN